MQDSKIEIPSQVHQGKRKEENQLTNSKMSLFSYLANDIKHNLRSRNYQAMSSDELRYELGGSFIKSLQMLFFLPFVAEKLLGSSVSHDENDGMNVGAPFVVMAIFCIVYLGLILSRDIKIIRNAEERDAYFGPK